MLVAGNTVTAYGRVIEANVSAMGLDESGMQALQGMSGGNAEKVAMFLAKWVE